MIRNNPFPLGLLCLYLLFVTLLILFISVSYTDKLCLYQSLSAFVYTSHVIVFAYTSQIDFLFIEYTSAPVEVSVWLGGITL